MGNKKKDGQEKSVLVVRAEEAIFNAVLVGRSPLVINRMSEKAKHELLWPRRKTTADKEQTMKHDPIQEFRDSIHRLESPSEPTLLGIPSASPKLACAAAALDTPGAKKAQVGRLTWVFGNYLPVYGMPKIYMTVVRMADMNRTPDIRTRCIVPEWAVRVRIRYVTPILNESSMATLLVNAGLYIGLGDGRNEKGKLSFGLFEVLSEEQAASRKDVAAILKIGRKEQKAAMQNPEMYDSETAELFSWFNAELRVRGKKQQKGAA